MANSYHVFYNTHYAAVSLNLDYSKKVGIIELAESLQKDLKPNQISAGQKIYDWDNSFVMNISPVDANKLLLAMTNALKGIPTNETIFTDQSKSNYNPLNLKTKTLLISNTDKDGNVKKDKDGNISLSIVANMTFLNGNTKYIYFPLNGIDKYTFYNYLNFCATTFPGLTAMFEDLVWYLTGKGSSDIKKERFSNRNNYNKQNNNYQNNRNNYNNQPQNNQQQNSNAPVFNESNMNNQAQQPQQPDMTNAFMPGNNESMF